jgi:hypothetical protein
MVVGNAMLLSISTTPVAEIMTSEHVPFWVFLFSWTDSRIYLSADADDDASAGFNVLE